MSAHKNAEKEPAGKIGPVQGIGQWAAGSLVHLERKKDNTESSSKIMSRVASDHKP